MSENTKSEMEFERYLDAQRISWTRIREGEMPSPDYCLNFCGSRIICELKQLDSPNQRPSDPHPRIRAKIEAAWAQLRDFPNDCCCIVLYDTGSGATVLQRDFIYGAMLGKLTMVTPFHPKQGALIEQTYTKFSEAGAEMRWETGEPHKANVSAIIVLDEFSVGQKRFLGTYHRQLGKLGRVERAVKMWEAETRARGTKRDSTARELRVLVYENPYASKPLPKGVFRGPYDERYGPSDGRIKRTFVGRELQELKRKYPDAFRSPIARIALRRAGR